MTKRRLATTALALAVCGIAALAVWWMVRSPLEAPGDIRDVSVSRESPDAVSPTNKRAVPSPMELAAVGRPWEELPPQEVIDSPDCLFVAGTGEAAGVAVVLAGPSPDAAWYAVVDEDGVLFGGFGGGLKFATDRPPFFDLGRRLDGSVLMGYGTFELNAQIVLDGQSIYEAEGVRSFDVASDGSSFLVIEPLAGDASRLVIRNLNLGVELHHDLGDLPNEPRTSLWYSADGTEAIIQAGPTYRFYPVDGGEPREIRVPDQGSGTYPIFQSREVGFHVKEVKGEFAKIARVEHRFGDNGMEPAAVEVWSRTFPFEAFGEPTKSPSVSRDGAWVVLGFNRQGLVLDASTGETTVSVPFDGDARKARGNPTGVHFQEGRFFLYRQRITQKAGRRLAERFVEVFDPTIVNLQGEPGIRMPIDTVPQQRYGGFFGSDTPEASLVFPLFPHGGTPEKRCTRPVLGDGRILVADGNRLTYKVSQSD